MRVGAGLGGHRQAARLEVGDRLLAGEPSSRIGVTISSSGASTRSATSKRTWSLPAPVEPCATARAPIRRATSTTESACWVRSAATLSG